VRPGKRLAGSAKQRKTNFGNGAPMPAPRALRGNIGVSLPALRSRRWPALSRYNLPFVKRIAVLAPRAVLVTDFTVPESPQSEGDGKNLAPLPHHLRCYADSCWQSVAFLPPSSFGSRYGRANNKIPSSESVVATDDLDPRL
jgi:hypothetical protein